ncbi:MAG: glycosyltransferase, partial [Candidatus Kerfeldbacteria bacterium]|nr:glycosyltransferase [Candidatus Kerfeldbacteria bacterium]
LFLMPSRFEPCGLGQMIAMRYGTIPVVRATGGLKDTVREGPDGTGFLFGPYTASALLDACTRAIDAFRHDEGWRELQVRAMRQDLSWAAPARRYADLYLSAIAEP